MNIYAARYALGVKVTAAALNTKLATLNTIYSTSVANVAVVYDGDLQDPGPAITKPAVLYYVGPGQSAEVAQQGKRDSEVRCAIEYRALGSTAANAHRDVEISLEAIALLLETLDGVATGLTSRAIVMVRDLLVYRLDALPDRGAPVKFGGIVEFTLMLRTEGL